MGAKELVYDAVLRRRPTSTRADHRAAFGALSIDGILHAAEPFDRPTGDAVVNVFKVLSAMDISEKRKPQDGSFGAKLQGRDLDFPRGHVRLEGRREVVMRILDNSSAVTKMEDLGMRPKLVESVRGLVTQPHGMFLCCGADRGRQVDHALRGPPRNRPLPAQHHHGRDPIEYHLDNVTQMEVNTKSGKPSPRPCGRFCGKTPTFIMIGEIRTRNRLDRLPGGQHRAHGLLDRSLQPTPSPPCSGCSTSASSRS